MRISTISLIIITALTMNGCLLDRIKQRQLIQRQLKEQQQHIKSNSKSNLGTRSRRASVSLNQQILPTQYAKQEPVLYTPSASNLAIEKDNYIEKRKITTNKKYKKKTTKITKYKKRSTKHKKRVAKVTQEPYSIEKNEADPELLGPQTTLESNPLTEVKKKI